MFRITIGIGDTKVSTSTAAVGESSSVLKLIDQLEDIADKLLAG
jgi:hypothetical protein